MSKGKKVFLFIIILILVLLIILGGVGYWLFTKEPTKYYDLKSKIFPVNELGEDVEPVNKDFGLIVPKIGINVPVIADVDGLNPDEYLWKVTQGVAHFKHKETSNLVVDGAYPGETGNIFLFGHSQIPGGDTSKYQAVFNDLPALKFGDKIIVYFKEQKHEYRVIEGKIIAKDELKYLEATPDEVLHLMTCWPLGFNNKRYIVVAEKIIE